jgi:hypothetical protein
VREYKVFKTSLNFTVNTEEAENKRNSTVKNVINESLSNVSSAEVNKHETSKLEATLNDVDHSDVEPDHGSGILTETPSLDDSTMSNLPFPHIGLPSFSGSGVSAEPIESETTPNREVITQPFDVVDGTTLYYGTDGEETESKLHVSQVQPTFTTLSVVQSVIPEQKSKLGDEPAAVAPAVVGEPSISAELGGSESNEKDMQETQLVKDKKAETAEKKEEELAEMHPVTVKEAENVKKKEEESSEKKAELGTVADKKETDFFSGKEVESGMEHKQEENAEKKYVDSFDESKSEADAVEDKKKKKESFQEPVKELDTEIEESDEDVEVEYDGKEDEEGDDYDDVDDDDDDVEEEVHEEVTRTPHVDTEQKYVEEVKSVDDPTLSAGDETKVVNQGTTHLSPEADINTSNVPVNNNSEADDLNLLGDDAKDLSLELAEKHPEAASKEAATNEPSIPEHTTPLLASENQNGHVDANPTEDSVGSAEESELRVAHENVTKEEGSAIKEQVDIHRVSADTDDSLYPVSDDAKSVEEKAVIDGSSEVIESVHGSGYSDDIPENLKKQFVNVLPELVSDENKEYNSEMSSEIKDEIKSNVSDEPHHDSIQDEIEVTTRTSSKEDYDVPLYETSTEETYTVVPTLPSEELKVPVENSELLSEQDGSIEPSGRLFSGVVDTLSAGIGVLTSMFGGSSSDSHTPETPEEANESKMEVTSENIPHTDEVEEVNRKRNVRDAAWSSLWDGPIKDTAPGSGGNHYLNEERERMCKLNLILLFTIQGHYNLNPTVPKVLFY